MSVQRTLDKINALPMTDKRELLKMLVARHTRLAKCADGTRVQFDKLDITTQNKILRYIENRTEYHSFFNALD
jgi:hypothetical protein